MTACAATTSLSAPVDMAGVVAAFVLAIVLAFVATRGRK